MDSPLLGSEESGNDGTKQVSFHADFGLPVSTDWTSVPVVDAMRNENMSALRVQFRV